MFFPFDIPCILSWTYFSHLSYCPFFPPLFLNSFNFNIFWLCSPVWKVYCFIFPLLKIMSWKGLPNQWGIKVSAEKDLIRKLSANTYKMSSKNQLLIKLKYYYFFIFWTIMLLLLINACTRTLGFFPTVTAFCHL